MPRLSEMETTASISMLLYGASKAGKTWFIGTAGSRTLIINTGLGLMTLKSPGFTKKYPGVDPIVETIIEDAIPDNAKGFDELCDVLDKYLNPGSPFFNEFDTVVIDDATQLRRLAMNKSLEINGKEEKSQSLVKSKKYGMQIKAVQDYGGEMDLIDQILLDHIGICRKHGKHFIVTAHERIQYNKPSGIGAIPTVAKIRPGFTGSTFPDAVTGHFDLVWYLEKMGSGERTMYKCRTSGNSSLIAGGRCAGVFEEFIDTPSFPEVLRRIKEAK